MSDTNEISGLGTPPATDDVTASSSIWTIIVQVFTAPTKAFENFRANPNLIVPMLLVLILMAFAGSMLAEYQAKAQYDLMKTAKNIPAAVLEPMRDAVDNPDRIKGPIIGGLMLLLFSLIEAGIALFIGKVIFAGRHRFARSGGWVSSVR